MGQFSWLDCVDGRQIVDNHFEKVYVLIPREKGGGHIEETCYDGYGNFGRKDIYDLVADWNREMIPEILRKASIGEWHCSFPDAARIVMENFYNGRPLDEGLDDKNGFYVEKRFIGIIMGCYDEDNARLDYPIKITYHKNAVYEECAPSLSDPNQGWPPEEESEDGALWDIA